MTIMIVGLGPGDGRYITRQAWDILSAAETIYLRTERHPAVADLPKGARIQSFDHVYESAADFSEVYKEITETILSTAKETAEHSGIIVYAVPGDAMFGEASVAEIRERAAEEGIEVITVPGISFIEPTLAAVGIDGLDGLQLFDAIDITHFHYPPISPDIPLLLGQIYDRFLASEVKLTLSVLYPDEHEVMLIHGAGTADQVVERTPLYGIDRSKLLAHLTALYIPPLPYASTLAALAETIAHLRGPDGCPWDQEQTRQSMRATLLEEASEVLEALDGDDVPAICEELGDLLYHLVMQSQIALEQDEFRMTDMIAGINSKLKRRHPHVWGDWQVADSSEVVRNWERIKAEERQSLGVRPSPLDNIPIVLPSLARAQKMQERVKRVGFDWPDVAGVVAKVAEEINEVNTADTRENREQEVGDLIFAVVNWARWLGVDAESALRVANQRFERRFRAVERLAAERNSELSSLDLDVLDEMWEEAKRSLAEH
ncbi:MAG TPA: nucleoside triphosphate pyrophosphohydrolase [Patescibacteria group bacterium]|nr:nucleoside triphosphate pyrophosphohydrolase [Patescibacteria group bacterium]